MVPHLTVSYQYSFVGVLIWLFCFYNKREVKVDGVDFLMKYRNRSMEAAAGTSSLSHVTLNGLKNLIIEKGLLDQMSAAIYKPVFLTHA